MKNLPRYIDLAFCLMVLPVMAMIYPVERWLHNFPWFVVMATGWLYGIYVLNRAVTVPLLFSDSRRRRWGIALILLSIVVTYFISQVTLYEPKPHLHEQGALRLFPFLQHYQQAVWSLFMIVEAFSFAIGLLTQTNRQRAQRRAVEAERDRAAIELYKAQIKPHFMFNTLNSLYGLFLTRDEKALESLEKFISMLRYIHTTSSRDFVSLSDEADYIRRYVDLQSLRLNGMTKVDLKIDIEDADVQVPPMLLVTFVENCFKHGVSPVEQSVISIRLTERDHTLELNTQNRIFPVRRIGEHLGIDNCSKRLALLYPDSHLLDITDDGSTYNVKLRVFLNP